MVDPAFCFGGLDSISGSLWEGLEPLRFPGSASGYNNNWWCMGLSYVLLHVGSDWEPLVVWNIYLKCFMFSHNFIKIVIGNNDNRKKWLWRWKNATAFYYRTRFQVNMLGQNHQTQSWCQKKSKHVKFTCTYTLPPSVLNNGYRFRYRYNVNTSTR